MNRIYTRRPLFRFFDKLASMWEQHHWKAFAMAALFVAGYYWLVEV